MESCLKEFDCITITEDGDDEYEVVSSCEYKMHIFIGPTKARIVVPISHNGEHDGDVVVIPVKTNDVEGRIRAAVTFADYIVEVEENNFELSSNSIASDVIVRVYKPTSFEKVARERILMIPVDKETFDDLNKRDEWMDELLKENRLSRVTIIGYDDAAKAALISKQYVYSVISAVMITKIKIPFTEIFNIKLPGAPEECVHTLLQLISLYRSANDSRLDKDITIEYFVRGKTKN